MNVYLITLVIVPVMSLIFIVAMAVNRTFKFNVIDRFRFWWIMSLFFWAMFGVAWDQMYKYKLNGNSWLFDPALDPEFFSQGSIGFLIAFFVTGTFLWYLRRKTSIQKKNPGIQP